MNDWLARSQKQFQTVFLDRRVKPADHRSVLPTPNPHDVIGLENLISGAFDRTEKRNGLRIQQSDIPKSRYLTRCLPDQAVLQYLRVQSIIRFDVLKNSAVNGFDNVTPDYFKGSCLV